MKILEVLAHMDDRRALRARSARRWQPSGWTYVQITWMRKSEPRLQEFGRWPAATVLGVSSCTSSNAHTKPAPNVRATSANAHSSERTHKRRTHFNQMSLREFFMWFAFLFFLRCALYFETPAFAFTAQTMLLSLRAFVCNHIAKFDCVASASGHLVRNRVNIDYSLDSSYRRVLAVII